MDPFLLKAGSDGGREGEADGSGTIVLVQEGGGEVSRTLRKEGFLGECGDAKGKLRGVMTLPKVTRGTSKQGPQVPHS